MMISLAFTTLGSRVSLHFQRDHAGAERLYERLQAIREKALGPYHPDVAEVLNYRAGLLDKQVRVIGRFQQTSCGGRGCVGAHPLVL